MTAENFTPSQHVEGLRCEGRSGCGSTDIVYVGPDDELPTVGWFRCANPRHHSAGTFCRYYSDARPTRAETESDSARVVPADG